MSKQTPDLMDMYEIKRKTSGHFFDASNMRFFDSRLAEVGYISTSKRRVYFVTSERFDRNTPRLYTVRVMDLESGNINTVADFQKYASRSGADKAAQRAALDDTQN